MQLAEIRDMVVDAATQSKEKACRKGPADLSQTIDVFRGGEPVATIVLKGGSARVLDVFMQAAVGYDADQMSVLIEGYTDGPNLPPGRNPITGEEIDNRTLSDLFLNHDGAGKGWVRECLYVQVYNRAGDMIAARLPYHYVGGRYLVWDERLNIPEDILAQHPEIDPDDLVAGGAMDEFMQHLMNDVPSFSQKFPGIVTEEAGRAELDLVVTEAIRRRVRSSIILWAHQGGEREEIIRDRMRRDH